MIILASQSPTRKRVLKQVIGDNFSIVPSRYIETDFTSDPKKLALRHSLGKAKEVAERTEGVVIGIDTFAVYNNKILGKPHTKQKAVEMLQQINGKIIKAVSGVTVIGQQTHQEYIETELKMKDLSDSEILAYVETGEPLDKAGAFATQEKGAVLVEWVKGDYYNIVGFPVISVIRMLRKSGINVEDYW